LAWCISAASLIACGDDDERATPNCDNLADCFTQPDGGSVIESDGGSD
jgi:hypothetical protein